MSQRNVAASVRARLLNKVRAEKLDFNLLLTRYGLERMTAPRSSLGARRWCSNGPTFWTTWRPGTCLRRAMTTYSDSCGRALGMPVMPDRDAPILEPAATA